MKRSELQAKVEAHDGLKIHELMEEWTLDRDPQFTICIKCGHIEEEPIEIDGWRDCTECGGKNTAQSPALALGLV